MEEPVNDIRFYWPSVSGYDADGAISFRLTGSEGDRRFTGRHTVPPADVDFPFWVWLHEHRHSFPSFFEEHHLGALRNYFASGPDRFLSPDRGLYCIQASWSGPAVKVETALRQALTQRSLPMPVHFIDTDSPDVDATFPQMRPFLHGWGELFGFQNGRCDLFFAFRQGFESLPSSIDFIFEHYAD